MDKYDVLKLDNQICFPLYACAKEVVRQYKPYLDELDLTYTQYIALMVLWEKAVEIPMKVGSCMAVSPEDAKTLYTLLHKILANVSV